MESNFFENLHARKEHLKKIAIKAKNFGWIDEQRMSEIIDKLDNDTLTIGVIGQMKCGKSTFLNAFVFEDDVLPSATTPMTAALSVIKYGEQKKLVAEFYTEEEWAEQVIQSKRDLSEIKNELEISKVKAAKELVARSSLLHGNVNDFLGHTQEDSFDNLIEYVGADGRFISITKSVTIYYPKDCLKGVEIVDTPGFNDPIVSREERTKEFLKRADVVLLMLYAGRPFDKNDEHILFEQVRSCGIGKVLVGINKYDIPFCSDRKSPEYGNIDCIVSYVKERVDDACKKYGDSRLTAILESATPIPLSAEMALLSELSMSKIQQSETYRYHWDLHCKNFGISTQQEMWKESKLNNLSTAITEMIEREKGQILFAKPINSIVAAGRKILEQAEKELKDCEAKIVIYGTPDDELEEKQEDLRKAIRSMNKKIASLEDDLDEKFEAILRKTRRELEDIVDASAKKMNRAVDNWGLVQSAEKIQSELTNEVDKLFTRDLKRCLQDQQESAQRELRSVLEDFFAAADNVILKHLPDFDQKEFLNDVKRQIKLSIDDDLFKIDPNVDDDEDYTWGNFVNDCVNGFLNGYTFGLWALGKRALSHSDIVSDYKKAIGDLSSQFDANKFLQSILSKKKSIVDSVKTKYQDEFLGPIQSDFDELENNRHNRESILAESKSSKEKWTESVRVAKDQISEIEQTLEN